MDMKEPHAVHCGVLWVQFWFIP